jgi:hypothetical protein
MLRGVQNSVRARKAQALGAQCEQQARELDLHERAAEPAAKHKGPGGPRCVLSGCLISSCR